MQILTFIFLCFVWGTTWIAIKISLEGFPPFAGAAIRFMLAILFLLIFIRLKKISLRLPARTFVMVSISAFLMYVLDYGLIYWGEQYLSAGVTAIFFATFPLFTGIWATFLFRSEKFYWNKLSGLILGLLGVIIVFLDQLLLTQFDKGVIQGAAAILLGAAGGAMSLVLIKKHLSGVNPVSLSFHQMAQGVIFLLFFSLIVENHQQIHLSLRVISAVVYLGAVGSALAFGLYYWLLQEWSAITLSLIIYITPLVALLVDYLVLGEIIQPEAVLGMLVIFSGVLFVQLNPARWIRLLQKLRTKPAD